jgi:hypothetical protein
MEPKYGDGISQKHETSRGRISITVVVPVEAALGVLRAAARKPIIGSALWCLAAAVLSNRLSVQFARHEPPSPPLFFFFSLHRVALRRRSHPSPFMPPHPLTHCSLAYTLLSLFQLTSTRQKRSDFLACCSIHLRKVLSQPFHLLPGHPTVSLFSSPMSAADVVFISGATGLHSFGINGPYDGTAEVSGGYAVYSKRGDGSVCIEHRAGKWQVKHVAAKGRDSSIASASGHRVLDDYASCVWRVLDGGASVDQTLEIVSGADAQRQASDCPLPPPHPPPPPSLPPP